MIQPLHITNARVWRPPGQADRYPTDLYFTDVVHDGPLPGARIVDLDGFIVFPGLVNAHDHLELNHYPRTSFREVYDNAHQWGEDVNARLNQPPFRRLRAYRIEDRLFVGGLKNLLCGATTVMHHNAPHPSLFRPDFPVRVLRNYGWAHSLHFTAESEIQASYRATPPDAPWFIHLAEGTDQVAHAEYRRLKQLGCVGPNTVIIHGVGLTPADARDAFDRPRPVGLVWCPSTNRFLLGATVSPTTLHTATAVAIGSDSRLTAAGDLLDEMRVAVDLGHSPDFVLSLATTRAANLLRLSAVGALTPGAPADFIAIPAQPDAEAALIRSRRADIALVVRGGIPRIGDPELMRQFDVSTVRATLDGKPKLIEAGLARRVLNCPIGEPGLSVERAVPARRTIAFLSPGFWRRRA